MARKALFSNIMKLFEVNLNREELYKHRDCKHQISTFQNSHSVDSVQNGCSLWCSVFVCLCFVLFTQTSMCNYN